MMDNLILRPVSEHDAESIARLDQSLTRVWRIEHWEDRIAFAMRRDPEGSLVAVHNGQLVAYLFSDVRGQEYGFAEKTGWIEAIAVEPQHQGSSIGKQLLEAVLQRFAQQRVTCVRTLVWQSHPELTAFLQHLGFEAEPVQVLKKTLAVAAGRG